MKTLEVYEISKSYGKKAILKNVSFSIEEGEIVGFVGPNGAGKTTMIRLITNLIYPNSGTITICGENVMKSREKALSHISAIVENPNLYLFLSGRDNLNFIRQFNHISLDKLEKMIDYIGLRESINQKVKHYSLGMKQRLALGMCLLSEPELLVLDEPTNGLDPSGTMALRNLILSQRRNFNMSMLISSHILSELEKICDRIIYIKDGCIVNELNVKKSKSIQLYMIEFKEIPKGYEIIDQCPFITKYEIDDNKIKVFVEKEQSGEFLKYIVDKKVSYANLYPIESHLEDNYSEIYNQRR